MDLVVEDAVLVELKTVKALDEACNASTISKATDLQLCPPRNSAMPHLKIGRMVVTRSGRSASISVHLLESA